MDEWIRLNSQADPNGDTIFHVAARSGSVTLLQQLLKPVKSNSNSENKEVINWTIKQKDGKTPLE